MNGINTAKTTNISAVANKGASSHSPTSSASGTLHKRKPKPHGKHTRPVPPKSDSEHDDNQDKHNETKTKSEFVTKTFGIIHWKKKCKISCPLCKYPAYSQAEANQRYKANHPPLRCSKCSQMFNNPCSLCRHFYSHNEGRFPCRNCSKTFPFESDLNAHRLKYRRHPGFMCSSDVRNGKA